MAGGEQQKQQQPQQQQQQQQQEQQQKQHQNMDELYINSDLQLDLQHFKPIDFITPVHIPIGTLEMSKKRLLKNFFVASFSFMLLFTAFSSIANLQSSLNKEEGLGVSGLAVMYACTALSGLFFAPLAIKKLGCKWALSLSILSFVLYMAANFYAVWATVIPGAIALGLGAAPLWSSASTYVTTLGARYAKLSGKEEKHHINRFFGYFFMFYHSSQIWGNLLSSLVYSREQKIQDTSHCGTNFCPNKLLNITHLDSPSQTKIFVVSWVYVSVGVIAFLISAIGLDSLPEKRVDSGNDVTVNHIYYRLLDTLRHLGSSTNQKLLVMMSLYSGVEMAFLMSDFTEAYVGCNVGISYIGYVLISYGIADAVCSFLFGRAVEKIGHIPFFLLAFVVHGGCLMYLLQVENTTADEVYIYYIVAALWGVGDAVIQTQTQAVHGVLFPDKLEAAFANYGLWRSLGFIAAFSSQHYLCTTVKIYVCFVCLTLAVLSYLMLELLARIRDIHQDPQTINEQNLDKKF